MPECCINKAASADNPHDDDCPTMTGGEQARARAAGVDIPVPADVEDDELAAPGGAEDPVNDALDPELRLDGEQVYSRELLNALASEMQDDYKPVEQVGRYLSNERHPKTSDADLWWAHFVGYLRGALDVVTGEDGIPPHDKREPDQPVVAEALALVASIAAQAGDTIARELADQATRPMGLWTQQRAFLRGAEAGVRALAAGSRELDRVLEAAGLGNRAEDAAWFEGFGRAIVCQMKGDLTGGTGIAQIAMGVTGALGHTPDEVRLSSK